MNARGWIGVDFDGTLATYHTWIEHGNTPGDPIEPMRQRVMGWLALGLDVRIFTARVAHSRQSEEDRLSQELVVRAWCQKHLGRELPVTACKDFDMERLYDDRCVQVEQNTGAILGRE
jgi:hypothetical protein